MINVGRPIGSKASAGVKDNTTTEGIVGGNGLLQCHIYEDCHSGGVRINPSNQRKYLSKRPLVYYFYCVTTVL